MLNRRLFLALSLLIAGLRPAFAQQPGPDPAAALIGRRVVARDGVTLRLDGKADADSRRVSLRVYKAEKSDGPRIWIVEQNGRNRGWAEAKDVATLEQAVEDATARIEADPTRAGGYVRRGDLRRSLGQYEGAIADLDEAVRLDPKMARAYYDRGAVRRRRGEHGKALADLDEAVRLKPDRADFHRGLAWILATAPDDKVRDGKRAVESATRGCELDRWQSSDAVGTLAAACAEAGDFAAAVKWQEKSIELLDKPDEATLAPYRTRLDLYRGGKPHREP